ncbi:MAG: hypothetical protein KIH64_017450 [Mycobacterium sp.]|nr:hypothetical protein [Mycobacterium sp.]
MNLAEKIIDWLRDEQLQIDEQWSYLLPTGFTWWADQYSQTVEFVLEETGPSGETGYQLAVRTELLRDLDLDENALAQINALPMRCASMSGPVYDAPARRLDLWSLVRVTDDNGDWIRYLLAAAAVTQLAEARLLGPVLAETAGALPATSDHPESGIRTGPHQMASAAGMFVSSGDEPCAWPESEFGEVLDQCTRQVPAAAAAFDGLGCTVEFPFGDQTSSCRMTGEQSHPLYGNGLLVIQRFPVSAGSDSEGIALALSLNGADLTREPAGYGLGSYSYSDGAIHYSGFVPNALYKPGLLANLYFSAAARAQRMASRFAEGRWDADAYSLDAAVLERRRKERQAAMPKVERAMTGCPMMRARAGG